MARTSVQTIHLDEYTSVELIAAIGHACYDAVYGHTGGATYYRPATERWQVKNAAEYIVKASGRELGILVKWDDGADGWGFQAFRGRKHPEHGRLVSCWIQHSGSSRKSTLLDAVGV